VSKATDDDRKPIQIASETLRRAAAAEPQPTQSIEIRSSVPVQRQS
jgi:hypothetical protein